MELSHAEDIKKHVKVYITVFVSFAGADNHHGDDIVLQSQRCTCNYRGADHRLGERLARRQLLYAFDLGKEDDLRKHSASRLSFSLCLSLYHFFAMSDRIH